MISTLQKIKDANPIIFIIGDVMLDRYLRGTPTRVSPEAPVMVLNDIKQRLVVGGAANVAANVAALGFDAVLFGRVGSKSEYTAQLRALLKEKGVNANLIEDDRVPTIVKTRILAGGQQIVRLDDELLGFPLSDALSKLTIQKFKRSYLAAIKEKRSIAVIFSDYDKGFLVDNIIQQVTKIVDGQSPILVDPKKADAPTQYRDATVIKPNLKELLSFAPVRPKIGDKAILAKNALAFQNKNNLHWVISLSEEGVWYQHNDESDHLPISIAADKVVDVSGAGDTMMAFLALGWATFGKYLSFDQVKSVLKVANHAAQLTCLKQGTSTLSWNGYDLH